MIRKAHITDIKSIHKLISEQAQFGRILARAMSELYSQVRDFTVVQDEETKELVGCGALQVVWDNLAEIRSLAVRTSSQGGGIGSELIKELIKEAESMGIERVFVLTYRQRLFERLGFEVMDKNLLPHKIWADCIHCAKFPECDEIAMTLQLNSPTS
jgi:amino-acid N-acetyltransferase